jgi:flagellar basal-body rod protein FlgB
MNSKTLTKLIQPWLTLKIKIMLSLVLSLGARNFPETHMLEKMTGIIDFNARALTLRAERQKIIASNIANADTPGYKAIDFNFSQALKSASTRSANSTSTNSSAFPTTSSAQHISTTEQFRNAAFRLQYRQPGQPSLDANTVDMDVEQARFADNSVRYEASLRFLNGQIRGILSAITGQS